MVVNDKGEEDKGNRGTEGCMVALKFVRHAGPTLKSVSNSLCLCKAKDPDDRPASV